MRKLAVRSTELDRLAFMMVREAKRRVEDRGEVFTIGAMVAEARVIDGELTG